MNTDISGELVEVISAAVRHHPRSLQRRIGPSEVGTPCTWCLAHKLVGVPEVDDGSAAWLPAVGTAVHAWLDNVFSRHDEAAYAQVPAHLELPAPRWLREERVTVGEIDGQAVTGSADLFDTHTGTVVDWKVVGETTLRSVKSAGAKPVYRAQIHLYGRGFALAGHDVRRVLIAHLPRNALSLQSSVMWSEPYDEQIALIALRRADALAKAIRAVGLPALLPTLQRDPSGKCFSCSRYPNADGSTPPKPGHTRRASAPNPFAA